MLKYRIPIKKKLTYADSMNKAADLRAAAKKKPVAKKNKIELNQAFKGEIGWIEQKEGKSNRLWKIIGASKGYKYEIQFRFDRPIKISKTWINPLTGKLMNQEIKRAQKESIQKISIEAQLIRLGGKIKKNPALLFKIAKQMKTNPKTIILNARSLKIPLSNTELINYVADKFKKKEPQTLAEWEQIENKVKINLEDKLNNSLKKNRSAADEKKIKTRYTNQKKKMEIFLKKIKKIWKFNNQKSKLA